MSETKIFKENPFRKLKLVALIFGGIILLLFILIALDGFKDLLFLLIIAGIFLFVFLITVFSMGFSSKRKVVCNAEGCEISSANLLQSYSYDDGFRWNEVSDTNIVERFQEVRTPDRGLISNYFFEVIAKGREIRVLDLRSSSAKTTLELIEFVNRATPHLKYVWEKNADFGNRQSIIEAKGYTKVAR